MTAPGDDTAATQVITAADDDPAERFSRAPDQDVDVTAFLPSAVPALLPDPDNEVPAPREVADTWEDRYAALIDDACVWFTDPSRIIAAARLAGEIREGLSSGLLGRSR